MWPQLEKAFFCVWFLSGEVTCAPLHPREARSGHLKSEDVPPNSSAIIYYSSWLLEANPWSLIGGFTDVRSFRFPLCETYSSVSWLKQGFFGLLVALKQIREICQTCNSDSSSYCTRCDLVWSLSSGLRSTRKNYENSPEPEISSFTFHIIFLVRTWCLLSTELWFGVWCALQLVDNSLQRRWAATGGINK